MHPVTCMQLNLQIIPSKMNFIKKILKPSVTVNNMTTTKLGRWQLHYDPKIVHSKVDQANEDHCGCCHEPTPMKIIQKPTTTTIKQASNQPSEEYYIPYVMSSF